MAVTHALPAAFPVQSESCAHGAHTWFAVQTGLEPGQSALVMHATHWPELRMHLSGAAHLTLLEHAPHAPVVRTQAFPAGFPAHSVSEVQPRQA